MTLPTISEFSTSIKTPELIKSPLLAGGHPVTKNGRMIKYSGGFCVVFPFETTTKKYAVRCWHALVSDAPQRMRHIADALKSSRLPYFVDFNYVEDCLMTPAGIQPVVIMDWVKAQSLKSFLTENLSKPERVNLVAENFKKMVGDLHNAHFSHGDLQHGNIMVNPDCSLVLVDYDSMYVPALKGFPDEIKGLQGYQHENRWSNKELTEKADYFSELVIYISLKALANNPEWWSKLDIENTDTLLFSGDDIKSKGSSLIFHELKRDNTLKHLVERLCDYMQKRSISELEPLEIAAVSQADTIAQKWKSGNGYKTPVFDASKMAESISRKWR